MKILGIVGSYRKNGVVDQLVTETLKSAEAQGATTQKIYLMDAHIEYCLNCRRCTQEKGDEPGHCIQKDDMSDILRQWAESDALVIGAPVNFFNITAVTRKFMERLVCFAYWPWGKPGPAPRPQKQKRKAVLITASAMPAIMGRFFTGAPRALRMIAKTMGAKPVQTIFVGLAAMKEQPVLSKRAIRKARSAGRQLAGK